MTQVDFYVLGDGTHGDRLQLACRIAEKARAQGKRVLIHTRDPKEAERVDQLLWTMWEASFIPHGRLGQVDRSISPILIGDGQDESEEHEVLVNLDVDTPMFFSRFNRLVECIDHDEAVRVAGRKRFAFYREHGYPLQSHTIS